MGQTLVLPRSVQLPGNGSLPRVGSVDAVALEGRAAELAKRSIKRESKVYALELAIRMMDLTTLEGADTPGKVRALCVKAMMPIPSSRRSRTSRRSACTRAWSLRRVVRCGAAR